MAKSTVARRQRKVPLSVHKTPGLWRKVYKGKRCYFGKVADGPLATASLAQWLEIRAGRTPTASGDVLVKEICKEPAQLVQKITDAIRYAHLKSVVHRDLKPGNVEEHEVKLALILPG